MKLFKFSKILLALLFLITTSFNFASALDVCRGKPVTLTYTVSGVQSGQGCNSITPAPGFTSPGTPQVNGGASNGSYIITVPTDAPYGVTPNFSLTCGNPSETGVDSLNVLPDRIWNGSVCTPLTWIRYCTSVGDANPNQFWEYSNSTPVGYRNTGLTCCSATGVAGTCAAPVANAPTLTASISPGTVAVGGTYTSNWNSTGATSVTAVCTGSLPGTYPSPVSGSASGVALAANIGFTNCAWTATGPGGSITINTPLTITAGLGSCPTGYTGTPPNCVLIPVTPLWNNYCGNGANSQNVINRIWQYRTSQPSDIRMHPDNLPGRELGSDSN